MGEEGKVLINESRGEELGSEVVRYKGVDWCELVKLFSEKMGLRFEVR